MLLQCWLCLEQLLFPTTEVKSSWKLYPVPVHYECFKAYVVGTVSILCCVSAGHCSLLLFRMALSLVSDRVLTYMLSALLGITRRPPRSLGFSLSSSLPWVSCLKYSSCFCVPVLWVSSPQLRKSVRLHLNSPALCCCCLETLKAVNLGTCRTHFTCFPSVKDHCLSLMNIQCLENHWFLFVCLWFLGWFVVLFIWLVKVVGQIQSPVIHFS